MERLVYRKIRTMRTEVIYALWKHLPRQERIALPAGLCARQHAVKKGNPLLQKRIGKAQSCFVVPFSVAGDQQDASGVPLKVPPIIAGDAGTQL